MGKSQNRSNGPPWTGQKRRTTTQYGRLAYPSIDSMTAKLNVYGNEQRECWLRQGLMQASTFRLVWTTINYSIQNEMRPAWRGRRRQQMGKSQFGQVWPERRKWRNNQSGQLCGGELTFVYPKRGGVMHGFVERRSDVHEREWPRRTIVPEKWCTAKDEFDNRRVGVHERKWSIRTA